MEIILNGKKKDVEEGLAISSLIDSLELEGKTIVVELNEEVMPKDQYQLTELKQNDRLEILHFVGGGQIDL